MKRILLDLCCKAGGCTRGYQRAGFYVVGVDIELQPHYIGDEFYQDDMFHFLQTVDLSRFVAIHASPPCQGYSKANHIAKREYPMLIGETRDALVKANKPFVIENVPGAPLKNPMLLCGAMFGLRTYRHRLFEANFPLPFMLHPGHGLLVDKSSGPSYERARDMVQVWGKATYKGYLPRAKAAMGIDWDMNEAEIGEAIPPVYTEFVGHQLMQFLGAAL